MKQLYYTHAYPHLIGAITIWGTANIKKTYLQPLVRTQKKIIRLITNNPPRTHTKPLMHQLSILNLANLFILRVALELHPFVHPRDQKNRPEHIHHPFPVQEVHGHRTRLSLQQQLYIPNRHSKNIAPTASYLQQTYQTIWNSLPETITMTTSLRTFKKLLREHLLAEQQ
jgi:hypothetical protein